MNSPIESAWDQLDECAQVLKKRANEFAKAVERVAAASTDGDLKLAVETLGELSVAVGDLGATCSAAEAAAAKVELGLNVPHTLEAELLETFRTAFTNNAATHDLKVFAGFESVFVYPVRVSIKETASGPEVLVRGQRTPSRRPSRIGQQVKDALKETRPPEQLAKALYRAFRALAQGKDEGRASLLALFEVLGAAPAGGANYNMERFTLDLLVLYAALDTPLLLPNSVVLTREDFFLANAAKGVQIVLPDGRTIVLGSVQFVRRGEVQR